MTNKNGELLEALDEHEVEELEKLALQLPECRDVFIKEFQKDPDFAKECIRGELEEYAQTGDIRYLLSTLKDVATAKGWVWLAKETGLSRPTLYETLNGKSLPRIDTLVKILNALGFRMHFVASDAPITESAPTVRRQTRKTSTTRTKKPERKLQRA